jgi:hypothetical protein
MGMSVGLLARTAAAPSGGAAMVPSTPAVRVRGACVDGTSDRRGGINCGATTKNLAAVADAATACAGLSVDGRIAARVDSATMADDGAAELGRRLAEARRREAAGAAPYIALVAYWLATMRLYRGPTQLRVDDFLSSLAIGEAADVLAVFLPLLWVARGAHAQHVGRRVVGLPAT